MQRDPLQPDKLSTDEVLTRVHSETTEPPEPPVPSAAEAQAELPKQGRKIMSQDGRTAVWEYTDVNGEKFVLPRPVDKMSIEEFTRSFKLSLNELMPGRLPQNLTVIFKDEQWAGHWFNCMARKGRRLADARGLGFIAVKAEELEAYMSELNDKDGCIRDDDLVLFKIHKAQLYLNAMRRMALAQRLGGKGQYMSTAENSLNGNGGDKVGYYYAPNVEKEFTGLGPIDAVR